MDTLNSAKFTSKMIETHLRCVLLFSVMIDAPTYLTGHLSSDLAKNPVQSIPGQFVNKSHNFHIRKTY